MSQINWFLAIAVTLLLCCLPLLLYLVRALSAPWRQVALRYPGPSPEKADQITFVTARFWGRFLPFSLTRAIRIRTTDEVLCFSVAGLDFLPSELCEIVIPKSAITACTATDRLVARQTLTVADCPVRIVLYGKGAKFVRAWWNSVPGGAA